MVLLNRDSRYNGRRMECDLKILLQRQVIQSAFVPRMRRVKSTKDIHQSIRCFRNYRRYWAGIVV